MKKYFLLVAVGLFVTGFGVWAATPATGLEGEYVDESDGGTLTITADHWIAKVGGIVDDEVYTAKKIGDHTFEITCTLADASSKGEAIKSTARQEGDFLFTKIEGSRIEVKWKKRK
jgi:hypothetical protein